MQKDPLLTGKRKSGGKTQVQRSLLTFLSYQIHIIVTNPGYDNIIKSKTDHLKPATFFRFSYISPFFRAVTEVAALLFHDSKNPGDFLCRTGFSLRRKTFPGFYILSLPPPRPSPIRDQPPDQPE
ncbi:MAG: hypothetical protein LUE23_12130, partial [Lachnospiraceae bacterium]|nr:hypothetical protein [Lachnospiraceae bacterium]